MNNLTPHNDIEKILASKEKPVLRMDERDHLKADLMARINGENKVPARAVPSPYSWHMFERIAGVFAIFVCVIGLTGWQAYGSLPGESLYAAKLRVIEPVVSGLTFTSSDPLTLQSDQLERRLNEVQLLQAEGPLSPAAESDVAEALASYREDILASIATATSTSDSLSSIDETVALLEAHDELLSDGAAVGPMVDLVIKAKRERVSNIIKGGATSTVTDYVDESLDFITTELKDDDHASSTLLSVDEAVDDTATALTEGDLLEAHDSISEANQSLLREGYLEAKEQNE